MPYSKLNDNEFERISAKVENFSFTSLYNNDHQPPFKQIMRGLTIGLMILTQKLLMTIYFQMKLTAITLSDLTNDTGESFSIFHLNIHSIQLHIDEFRTFLDSFKLQI